MTSTTSLLTSSHDLREVPVFRTNLVVIERLIEVGSPARTLLLVDKATDTVLAVDYVDDVSFAGRAISAMVNAELAR
jgi:hypothetical protein